MKLLEELSQFSPLRDLVHQVPVNGPWDEQNPLVPIIVVCNNILYFIVASVLSTPLELLLPRSLVTSSGPNLKAIIPFICSLTFWLHVTDPIIISVLKSWFKDSVLEPVSPVNFLIALQWPSWDTFFHFFLTLQGSALWTHLLLYPNHFYCNNNFGFYHLSFFPDGDTAALACLRAAKTRHLLISLTSHPRCFITRQN